MYRSERSKAMTGIVLISRNWLECVTCEAIVEAVIGQHYRK